MKNNNLWNGYVIALLRYLCVSLIESQKSESRHLNNKPYANSFAPQSFSPPYESIRREIRKYTLATLEPASPDILQSDHFITQTLEINSME